MVHDVTPHDVIGGHQTCIHSKKDREMGHLILQMAKSTRAKRL